MRKDIKNHIEDRLCVNIENVRPVSGGDISQAYQVETQSERFFCKINYHDQAYNMFLAEKRGLEAIAHTQTVATPKVLICEALEKGAMLLMMYVAPKRASPEEMSRFGHQLAAMHQQPGANNFGWEADNFIGSLPQSNNYHTDWSAFFVAERLRPQLEWAQRNSLLQDDEIPSGEALLKGCTNLFPEVSPSLLHGDLWGGNYLISKKGVPYLIDPSTYYGHHEVDIAMTRLFGGFGEEFYHAYAEHFPTVGEEAERQEVYQLYYLLVHLNLFGKSYYQSVKNTLKRYF